MERSTTPDESRSPAQSALAIFGGYIALIVLEALYGMVLQRFAASELPSAEGEGTPTELGLILSLAGALPNGIAAGLVAGRLTSFAPIGHAAVLGSVVAFQAMLSSHHARGLPWWFALGRIVLPLAFIVAGGVLAKATSKRR